MTEILPRVYLSGSFSMNLEQEVEWVRRTGVKYKCYSYAFVGEDAFFFCKPLKDMLDYDISQGVGIMIDSGAFSFHRFALKQKFTKKGKEDRTSLIEGLREETIAKYVEFIKQRGKEFDFYVNCDFVKNPAVVYEMQKRLEKMGIRPMPMVHGTSSEDGSGLDWLKLYLEEGYNYIGFGSSPGKGKWRANEYFMSRSLDLIDKYEVRGRKIKLHGFGRTSMPMMFQWPWYSVDSSTWAKCGCYGSIFLPSNKGVRTISVSLRRGHTSETKTSHALEGVAVKHIIDFVESRGFSYQKMTESKLERDCWNAYIHANIHEWKDAYLAQNGKISKYETLL